MRAAAAVALVAMMLAGCQLVDAQPEPPRTLAVVAIVDGDTITATTPEGERVRVRLLGIDAPEVAKDGQPAECGAEDARTALASLIEGRDVALSADPASDREDRYGRVLGYLAAGEVEDVGTALIEAGMAAAWWPRNAAEPTRGASYSTAQARAQRHRVGLWGRCASVGRSDQ